MSARSATTRSPVPMSQDRPVPLGRILGCRPAADSAASSRPVVRRSWYASSGCWCRSRRNVISPEPCCSSQWSSQSASRRPVDGPVTAAAPPASRPSVHHGGPGTAAGRRQPPGSVAGTPRSPRIPGTSASPSSAAEPSPAGVRSSGDPSTRTDRTHRPARLDHDPRNQTIPRGAARLLPAGRAGAIGATGVVRPGTSWVRRCTEVVRRATDITVRRDRSRLVPPLRRRPGRRRPAVRRPVPGAADLDRRPRPAAGRDRDRPAGLPPGRAVRARHGRLVRPARRSVRRAVRRRRRVVAGAAAVGAAVRRAGRAGVLGGGGRVHRRPPRLRLDQLAGGRPVRRAGRPGGGRGRQAGARVVRVAPARGPAGARLPARHRAAVRPGRAAAQHAPAARRSRPLRPGPPDPTSGPPTANPRSVLGRTPGVGSQGPARRQCCCSRAPVSLRRPGGRCRRGTPRSAGQAGRETVVTPGGQRGEGRVLARRYHLQRVLGRGAMGAVWEAEDTFLRRTVAVKEVVLPGSLSPEERAVSCERTLREARAIARLGHPNVVTLFDVLDEDARPWVVMELVPSRSLADIVREDGPLHPLRVATVGLAVLGALEAAHAASITHRDVKPGNILLGHDGRVKLTDFGIARSAGDDTITGTGLLVGSPSYIAPEIVKGHGAGPAADLWGLGATLYAAAEGRAPFSGGDAMDTLSKVVQDPPAPYEKAGPLVPALGAMLEKDPARRAGPVDARRLLLDVLRGGTDEPGPGPARRRAGPAAAPVPAPAAPPPPAPMGPRLAELLVPLRLDR